MQKDMENQDSMNDELMVESIEESKIDASQLNSSNLQNKSKSYSIKLTKSSEKLSKTLSKNALKLKMATAGAVNDPRILN